MTQVIESNDSVEIFVAVRNRPVPHAFEKMVMIGIIPTRSIGEFVERKCIGETW